MSCSYLALWSAVVRIVLQLKDKNNLKMVLSVNLSNQANEGKQNPSTTHSNWVKYLESWFIGLVLVPE